MKLCRCGAIVDERCSRCDAASGDGRTTAERGYDRQWRVLSERYRANHPVCQVCEWFYVRFGKLPIRAAEQVHHIVKVRDAPQLRLDQDNLLAVCQECHEWAESRGPQAREIKRWCDGRGTGTERR